METAVSIAFLMLFCLISTVVIECLLALAFFRVRTPRDLAVVALAQVATNPLVESIAGIACPLLVNAYAPDQQWICAVVLSIMEAAAFFAEGFIYSRSGFSRPYLMSGVLNASSFAAGILVQLIT